MQLGEISSRSDEHGISATDETCEESNLFCWPPGQFARVVKDSDVIPLNPQSEHTPVMDPHAGQDERLTGVCAAGGLWPDDGEAR